MTRPKLKNVVFGVVAPLWILLVAICCFISVVMTEDHEAGYHYLCPVLHDGAPSVPDSAPAPATVHNCSEPYSCIKSYPDPKEEEFLWIECSEKTPWACNQV